jgi:hypothetical protein
MSSTDISVTYMQITYHLQPEMKKKKVTSPCCIAVMRQRLKTLLPTVTINNENLLMV